MPYIRVSLGTTSFAASTCSGRRDALYQDYARAGQSLLALPSALRPPRRSRDRSHSPRGRMVRRALHDARVCLTRPGFTAETPSHLSSSVFGAFIGYDSATAGLPAAQTRRLLSNAKPWPILKRRCIAHATDRWNLSAPRFEPGPMYLGYSLRTTAASPFTSTCARSSISPTRCRAFRRAPLLCHPAFPFRLARPCLSSSR